MHPTLSPSRALLTASVVLLAVGSLSACGLASGSEDAKRDGSTGEITEGSDADVFSIRVGDCFVGADLAGTVEKVPTVPCSEPHDSEMISEKRIEGDKLPADAELIAQGDEYCVAQFEAWVGGPYAGSSLEYTYLYPTPESWDAGDRSLQCVVMSAEPVSGTLKGSKA